MLIVLNLLTTPIFGGFLLNLGVGMLKKFSLFMVMVVCSVGWGHAAQLCIDTSVFDEPVTEENFGAWTLDWSLVYADSQITVKGISVCSDMAGNRGDVAENLEQSGFGDANCWCRCGALQRVMGLIVHKTVRPIVQVSFRNLIFVILCLEVWLDRHLIDERECFCIVIVLLPCVAMGGTCPAGYIIVEKPNVVIVDSCSAGSLSVDAVSVCGVNSAGVCWVAEQIRSLCNSGIHNLKSSGGVGVALWAERGTVLSLCVKYNGMVCYADLESGQSSGAINVKYNGVVYHTMN